MKGEKVSVNIVVDHKVVTDGLMMTLSSEKDIEVFDVAQSGEQLLSQLSQRTPDIIILDYNLISKDNSESMNGLQTAKKVMSKFPKIKILMLSMHDSPAIIVTCIESGIHGYMLKGEKYFNVYHAVKQLYEKRQ